MKAKRGLLKSLIGVAGVSAALLAAVCIMAFVQKGSSSLKFSDKELQNLKNPLNMIVYAAEIPVLDDGSILSHEAVETIEPDLNPADAILNARLNDSMTSATVEISGLDKANKMVIAVWSENNGQDDLKWYDMKKNESGSFNADIPIKNHHTEGKYRADAYIVRSDNTKYIIGSTSFLISGPTLSGASFENVNVNAGTFKIKINKAASSSRAKKAKVNIYPAASPNNSKVYEVELSAEGDGVIDANVSNHNYASGEYKAEIIIVDENEIEKNLLQISTQITLPQMTISQNMNPQKTIVNLNVNNLVENSVSKLDFEVYSKDKGKDDLVSYPAAQKSASSFEANAVISNHHTAGEYQVDVYADRGSNKKELLGSATFNVDAPVAGSIAVSQKNEDDEYFKTSISGASSAAGITQMRFQVLRNSDNHEMWFESNDPSSGNAEIMVDIKDQTESVDSYTITGYIKDSNGIETKTEPTDVTMTFLNNGKYKIMGQTRTNVAQMVKYFNDHAYYPSFYANSDAPTIEAFCQIFYDEAVAEGVRAEVAFCQAMKETGYLKFGGDVSIAQYNFAGIGATGNGEPGNSFGSVRDGVRAQIQHLKAYASTSPLNQACIDPRFSFVKRGSAIYVEWLGIGDNPSGGGWAAGSGYGPSIVNSYIRKLFSY